VLVAEGQKVPVGAAIAVLATGKENAAEVKKQYQSGAKAQGAAPVQTASKPAATAASAGASASGNVATAGGGVATLEAASNSEIREPENVGHGATRSPAQAVPPIPSRGDGNGNGNGNGGGSGNGNGNRVVATPLARRIAADKGIDLHELQGSGPNGRIVQADVLAFQPQSAPTPGAERSAAPAPARTPGPTEVIPLNKMRSAIAAALQRSKQQIPHFYETIDVDVEELSAMRVRVNEQLEKQKVKLSLADFIARAVCVALQRNPAVNATFDGTQITRHSDVHLGVAVAVADGLIVPVLKHADKMGLKELRERTGPLIDRARAGKQKQDEVSGGTFTISSLGSFGIREFAAIINPPQVAILAVGAAEKRAVVRNDQIVARTMMSLTLSADHRVVDGATAAEFLRTLKTLLEEPGMMLV
jgi:pyruvate dehydrogenase E2 component (dihydrolipoamide acetyltransferase)